MSAFRSAVLGVLAGSADGPPPAGLELAVLSAIGTANATASTISTGSTTLAVGDRLVACFAHRGGTTVRTHSSITSTGWTATWTQRPDFAQTDASAPSHHRASIWDGVVTSAGAGVATGTLNAAAFQLALLLFHVPGMAAVDTQTAWGNETGTTVSAAWASTPDANSLGIAFMCSEGNPLTMGVTGLTAITDTNLSIGTAFQVRAFQKLGSLPDPLAGTGASSNRAKILAGLAVTGIPVLVFTEAFTDAFKR